MEKPTQSEIMITAALLEQLLCNFEPIDSEEMQHAEIAGKVAKFWLTNHSSGRQNDGVSKGGLEWI